MQAANRVIKNTLFLYAKMFITVFSSLYTTRLILDALGINDFGIFNLVAGLISMMIFLNAAMTAASQRFMSFHKGKGDDSEQKSIFVVSFLIHVLIAVITVIILESISFYLFDNILKINEDRIEVAKIIYHFAVLSTFFTILSVPYDAVINSHENMLFVAILGIIESFLKLGIAIFITTYAADKLLMYGFLMSMIIFVNFLIKLSYSFKKYEEVNFSIKTNFQYPIMKKMLHFASYSFLGSFTSIINNYAQAPLLNMFFGTIVNAAQGIVGQVSGQLGAFAQMMMQALNPLIAKSEGAGNREMMLKASFTGAKFAFFLLIFFYIPLFFEMDTVLDFWLVEIPPFTLIFCKLLLIRNLIEQLYLTLYSSIAATGDIKNFQIYSSIITIFPLAISFMLFKMNFEAYVLYIVNITYSFIYGLTVLYFAKKVCGLSLTSYFKEVVFKAILSLVLISAIVFIFYFIFHSSNYRWVFTFTSSFLGFIFVIYNFGLSNLEREFIKKFINKKREQNG